MATRHIDGSEPPIASVVRGNFHPSERKKTRTVCCPNFRSRDITDLSPVTASTFQIRRQFSNRPSVERSCFYFLIFQWWVKHVRGLQQYYVKRPPFGTKQIHITYYYFHKILRITIIPMIFTGFSRCCCSINGITN